MAKTISKIISVKASPVKPLGKLPPGDKILRIDPQMRSYYLEDSDKTD